MNVNGKWISTNGMECKNECDGYVWINVMKWKMNVMNMCEYEW